MYSFNSLNYANYARYLSNSRFDSTRFEGRSHHFCLSMQSRRLSSAVLDKIKLLRKLFSQHSSVKKGNEKNWGHAFEQGCPAAKRKRKSNCTALERAQRACLSLGCINECNKNPGGGNRVDNLPVSRGIAACTNGGSSRRLFRRCLTCFSEENRK